MTGFFDVLRNFPLLSLLVIAGPFIGGIVGAYMGFDSLGSRLANERQNERIESRQQEIKEDLLNLSVPIESLRRYERELAAQGQNFDVLKRVLTQYDQLRQAIEIRERFVGGPDTAEQIAAAEHVIGELRALLGITRTIPGPGGQILIIKTAPNTFRVTFAVPMRRPPDLTFRSLKEGVVAHVLEKTALGFTVIFTPSEIPVETFGLEASAEL